APPADELAPVGLFGMGERVPDQLQLAPVERLVAGAAQKLETLENEVGVGHVGFAILPDIVDLSRLIRFPDLRSVHPQLSGKSEQARNLVERRLAAILVKREDVHQVDVPHVKAVEIIVVPEVLVLVTLFPVARRAHAVNEAAVVQHRKVKAAAVPRYELRGVLLYAVEKAPDEHGLAFFGAAQRPAAERILVAQRAGDRHHA